MLNNVKINIRTSFPFLKKESGLGYSQEVSDTILTTALLSIPLFVIRGAPVSVYCNLFLYSFTSLFLSQVRCRIIGNNLKLLREARDEQSYLQRMAKIDPLTQVLNRNGFSQRLDTLIASAAQHGAPVAVIMVDIDYFKQYNDMYGHIAGEEFQLFLYGIKPGGALHPPETAPAARRIAMSWELTRF